MRFGYGEVDLNADERLRAEELLGELQDRLKTMLGRQDAVTRMAS